MSEVKITMPIHRVLNKFRDAANSAFRFASLLKKHEKQEARHEKRLEDMGGKLSPTWIVMSIIGLFAAIGFTVFGAFNAQNSIAGLIDPNADKSTNSALFSIIGASLSIFAMLAGHYVYEGLTEGFKTDVHTGEKSTTPKFWIGVVAFIASIAYVACQFLLVKTAVGADKEDGAIFMPYVVGGIAILELLVGGLILNRAFEYIVFFFASILIAITLRQIHAAARDTNDYYRQYIPFVDAFNHENPGQQMEREGSPNIRKAIMFYSGIAHQNDDAEPGSGAAEETPPQPQPSPNKPVSQNDAAPIPEREASRPNHTGTNGKENAEQAVNDFINDTTEHDLTA